MLRTTFLFLGSLLLCACTTQPPIHVPSPEARIPSTCDGAATDLRVVTFNAGDGAGMVTHAKARKPVIVDAVADLLVSGAADIVLGQEFWDPETTRLIAEKAGLPPGGTVWADLRGRNEDPEDTCRGHGGPYVRLSSCALERCRDVPAEEAAKCAMRECRRPLVWLYLNDLPCFTCLLSQTGKKTADMVSHCSTGHGSRIQGGMSGLVIFSTLPIRDARFLELPSSFQNGGALMVTVTARSGADVAVMDVHVPASSPAMPRQSDALDWDDAKARYLGATLDAFRSYAGDLPRLYGGDVNFSMGNGATIETVGAWQWEIVRHAGYADPVADALPGFCTACPYPENLTRKRSSRSRENIDRVFLADPPGGARASATCTERVIDRSFVFTEKDGSETRLHPSDHFGTLVGFRTSP